MTGERGLLRNGVFMALWGAQILSQVAANATTFALIVLVAQLTKSNTSSSILILLSIVPAVAFGIFAGVIVDRSDRKRVLVVTNALRAVAVTPLLFGETVVTAYLVNALVASVTVFFVPAESATIPAIVRRRDLLVANSLFTFTFNGAFLVGFIILAPIAIALVGFQALFAIVAAMFGGAAVLCITLPNSGPAQRHMSRDVAGEAFGQVVRGAAEAFRYLRSVPLVVSALVHIALTYTLVAVAGALAPGFVREVLGFEERNVVVLVAPAGIGVVAGLGILNIVSRRFGRARAISFGMLIIAGALVLLAAARPVSELFHRAAAGELGAAFPFFVGLVSLIAFVFGVGYAFITVPSMTLLQEELRDDIRGRVFGMLNMLVSVFSLFPLLIVGPIADLYGVAPVFVGAAALVLGVWSWARRAATAYAPKVTVTE
ncbi:MAG: MFS transporter [Candidatus Limnocylindria bacterium]